MLIIGDARKIPLADESVDCVVTSPPYWGLRDYSVQGQIGLEATPNDYVETIVAVFREVRRVLKAEGTLWLNMGDSYVAYPNSGHGWDKSTLTKPNGRERKIQLAQRASRMKGRRFEGLKPKDLVGIPWTVAFALRDDGWWLRSEIIWHKPSPMPESVRDRPTRSHEQVFLLSKSRRYYYDGDAIREKAIGADARAPQTRFPTGWDPGPGNHRGKDGRYSSSPHRPDDVRWSMDRNARSVWSIPAQPFDGAHFATFPDALARRCILAGCPPGGIVFDPFAGSGTTVKVARELGRVGVGLELSPTYVHEIARERIATTVGMPL